MVRTFRKNRETLRANKKLSKIQLIGVEITFVFSVSIAASLIVYSKNEASRILSNIFVGTLVLAIISFFVFYFIETISDKMINKIAKGAHLKR